MDRRVRGYVYIVVCAVIFSTMEIMLKKVTGVFAPMQITVLRFLAGGALLLPFAAGELRRRGVRLTGGDLRTLALTGLLCVPVSMVLYQMAVVTTKASAVAVIFSSNSLFVVLLAFFLLREPIRRWHVAAMALEVLGILCIVNPLHTELSGTGVLLSLLSAAFFALYGVVGKRETARLGGLAVTCGSFLFGGGELLLLLLLGRTAPAAAWFSAAGLEIFAGVPLLTGIPASALPALANICAVNSAAGYVCHMKAMEYCSAKEASIVFFLKPAIAPLLALWLLSEAIPLHMWLGIVLFLAGSAVSIVPGLREERRLRRETELNGRTKKEVQDGDSV